MVDTRHEFGSLFSIYEWLTVGVAVIVFALVLFAALRYRRRRDEWPSGRDERKLAESFYVVLLGLIVTGLVTMTFRAEARIDPVYAHPKLRIGITGFQWGWRFDYQSGKTVIGTSDRQPILVVPVNESIQFTATSRDVIHSFWVPNERFKRDAFPDRKTTFDLVFDRVGSFAGRCAEFCGLHHADMDFTVRVLSATDFRAWSAAP